MAIGFSGRTIIVSSCWVRGSLGDREIVLPDTPSPRPPTCTCSSCVQSLECLYPPIAAHHTRWEGDVHVDVSIHDPSCCCRCGPGYPACRRDQVECARPVSETLAVRR